MGWRSSLGWLAFAGLLGCRPTSARGRIGEVDLTARLPAGVTVPATPDRHEGEVEACGGGEGIPPIPLRIRWTSFEQGGIGYVASCAVDLLESQDGLFVFLGKPKLVEGHDLPVVTLKLTLICLRMDLRGETKRSMTLVYVDPAGRLRTPW
jgi:hypothetical protein